MCVGRAPTLTTAELVPTHSFPRLPRLDPRPPPNAPNPAPQRQQHLACAWLKLAVIPPGGGVTYVLAPWVKKRFQGVRFRNRGRHGRAPGHRDLLAGSTAVFPRANRAAEAEAQSAALHERKTDGHDNQDHPMAETLADQDRVPNELLEGKGETPQEEGENTEPRIPEKAWRS